MLLPEDPRGGFLVLAGVLEEDVLSGERLVGGGEGVELGLGVLLILGVEENFEHARPVRGEPGALSDDLCGEDDVAEDGLVHGGEGAGPGPGEGEPALRRLLDPPVGNDHDMLAAELLLELAHQALLDLLEGLPEPEWDRHDHRLAPARDVHLARAQDVKVAQVALQLLARRLQVEQGLGHALLENIGQLALLLQDLLPCRERRSSPPGRTG
eukprot:CAMPEP_0198240480 /NCGR_PEP_ID=MMETSP1446-20131203/5577_1 /TAXON_ID=1461542 ORGANISM="Unidentified sp, Strain CCMP2111" /NCGR_SAMPLE_ID=MMETSP1446 /ASSEMBLY_ACC=CAM_ASM_001112 /LENGTH=211 /DNA_ID=CAMNT_0043923213 /DNA_START=290 /DNA_END=922 /DNA_ORIENTATION=-